jgi:hypothetical protein
MSVESLECENLDVNDVSDIQSDQVADRHPDTRMFAWTLIGALGTVLGLTIVVVLFY